MNKKTYSAYRPSGIDWLGDIPAHWDVRRLKSAVRIINGATPSTNVPSYWDGDISWITPQDLGQLETPYIKGSQRHITLEGYESCGTTLAPHGSVAISTRAPIGHIGLLLFPACVNQGCRLLVPNDEILCEYLYAVLKAVRLELVSLGQGSTFTELSHANLGGFHISFPPLAEQHAIVRYLDRADERTQRAISAKERLIELLTEQRQAVIQRAVTRGLDAGARMKASGVEWLGDVPAHWDVRRLGYLASKFGSGITPRGGATTYQDAGIPFLRSQNIHFNELRLKEVAHISESLHNELSGSHVKPDDVLLNITGASIGRVCSVPADFTEGNVNQHVCIIRPQREHVLSDFLSAYLSTPMMQYEIYVNQSGASREGLTLEAIRRFQIALPPIAEQAAIARHLDKATAAIDATITNAERQVELLGEYRARLIADAVTGRVDVRGQQ